MLDSTLHALADRTRRDMLLRMAEDERTVSELAEPYEMSMAAVSKHLKVLEQANLVIRRKQGRRYYCRMNYEPLNEITQLIRTYRRFWQARFDELEEFVKNTKSKSEGQL